MKKLLFIIPHLGGGGSERMFTNLCNNLDRNKFDITLLLLIAQGEYLSLLKPDIKIVDLKIIKDDGILKNTIKCLLRIPKVIKAYKPDIVMSTITHINIVMGIIKFFQPKSIRFIARESNILSLINKQDPFYVRIFYRLLYKRFDIIIAQSQDMKEDFKNYSIPENKITVINNFVDEDFIDSMLTNNDIVNIIPDKINLLSVGRLEFQKGYDLLLNSFSKFTDKDKFHLTILGRGINEKEIRNQIRILSLENHVTLLGFSTNPYKYMEKADVFISSSRFEGFPNVVIEALTCGLPVVANNYPGGINEVLGNNKDLGYIINIENPIELYNAINKCINKDRETVKLATRNKYSKNTVIKYYETLFLDKK
jgi:glycosyltransferase involved in cell wall biosynthesis